MNKQKLVLLLPLLLLVGALIPAIVQANGATVVDLSPTDDAYIYQGSPAINYGGDIVLNVQVSSSQGYYSFLKFDLSAIPTGSNIVSANLILQDYTLGSGTDDVYAYRVDGSWTESGITWATILSIESNPSASASYTGTHIWTFDVKTDVQSFVSGSVTNYGWKLAILGSGARQFVSKENAAVGARPVLEVTYGPSLPVPEYAFGALLAMVGCFAAFVIIKKPHLNLRIR